MKNIKRRFNRCADVIPSFLFTFVIVVAKLQHLLCQCRGNIYIYIYIYVISSYTASRETFRINLPLKHSHPHTHTHTHTHKRTHIVLPSVQHTMQSHFTFPTDTLHTELDTLQRSHKEFQNLKSCQNCTVLELAF